MFNPGDKVRFRHPNPSANIWLQRFIRLNGGSDIFTVERAWGERVLVKENPERYRLFSMWFEPVQSFKKLNTPQQLPFDRGLI